MPELPEVEALVQYLREVATGRTIARVELAALSALKTFTPPLDALVGRRVEGTGRRGKFIMVETAGSADSVPIWMCIHLARGGWMRWYDDLPPRSARPTKGPLALRVGFEDGAGIDITEHGKEKRLAVYVTESPENIEGIARLGPDPLDPSVDEAFFRALLAGKKAQLKGLLTDQTVLAGVGNAYSDEILHVAKLSPFKLASTVTPEEASRLFAALTSVLRDAVHRSAGLPAKGLKAEKRSGMRVHGRIGEACPECGDTVREVSFAKNSLQYCPTCQTGGKPLADRRLSRLVK